MNSRVPVGFNHRQLWRDGYHVCMIGSQTRICKEARKHLKPVFTAVGGCSQLFVPEKTPGEVNRKLGGSGHKYFYVTVIGDAFKMQLGGLKTAENSLRCVSAPAAHMR